MSEPDPTLDLSGIRFKLECVGQNPTIIYDPRALDDVGIEEMSKISHLLGKPIPSIAIHSETLDALFIQLSPDKRERYANGRPVVIYPIARDERTSNPKHRPTDTPAIKAAKQALEIGAFRLVAAQTEVQLARNTPNRASTRTRAKELALSIIGGALWRGGPDPDQDGQMSFIRGLLDRAGRIVAAFAGVRKPADVARMEALQIRERLDSTKENLTFVLDRLQAYHVDQARYLVDHRTRATMHESAMERWSAGVREGRLISRLEAIEICNAYADRMQSVDLMRIAIAGDLNPADVHRNWETERAPFEVGRMLGRLQRNQVVIFRVDHARILVPTFQFMFQQELADDKEACACLLAEAALMSLDIHMWNEILSRIMDTGVTETVVGKGN